MENSLVHADVFFFITTIAVVFVTTALVITLIYAIQILGDIRSVVRRLRDESELIVKDVHYVRETVRGKALRLVEVLGTLAGWVTSKQSKKRVTKKTVKKSKPEPNPAK